MHRKILSLLIAALATLVVAPSQADDPQLDISSAFCQPANASAAQDGSLAEKDQAIWLTGAEAIGTARVTVRAGVRTATQEFAIRAADGTTVAIVSQSCTSECNKPQYCVVEGCNPKPSGGCTECDCKRTSTKACGNSCKYCKPSQDILFVDN